MSESVVVKIKFGSHLYGTSTPWSDTDYKSVYLPSASDILLGRVKKTMREGRRDKAEGEKNLPTDIDNEAYSLDYFFELLASGQTVAIDMLFAPEPEITSPTWKMIQRNRDKLITKKASVFLGYCRQQANKYGIKGSRVAAARAAASFFKQAYETCGATFKVEGMSDYIPGLVRIHPDHMAITHYDDPKGVRPSEVYFECCNRKVPFKASVKLAAEIFTKIFENYGARALQAESNEGVDWKALSHAVRVGHEALELMSTGKVTFPLHNAAHVLEIKQGKLPYEQVSKEIEDLLDTVEAAEKISVLRDEPDYEWIDRFVKREHSYIVRHASYAEIEGSNKGKTDVVFSGPIC
jgi:hypothetical protein